MQRMLVRGGGNALRAARAAREASTAAGARAEAGSFVMDEKTRAEMRALHSAEPGRWTAGALAARFGAPVANAAAVVRLARRRPKAVSEAAARVEAAWIELAGGGRGRGRVQTRGAPTSAATAPVEMSEEAVAEKEEGDAVGATATAEWAREQIAAGEVETTRKTTYAFIEAGKGIGVSERAVWLRDAKSGKLRAPSKEERHVLLGLERVYPS